MANYGSGGAGKSAAQICEPDARAIYVPCCIQRERIPCHIQRDHDQPARRAPGYYYDAATNSYVKDPPGTYSTGGATVPIADPGGTYSAAGASAPTTDPAGTYSSPYALNRLVIVGEDTTPANAVLSFQQRNGGGELLWRHE